MAGPILTTGSSIMCPHGGQAVLFTTNTRVTVGGMPALIETDIHPIAGCPFTIGPKYSPCIRIQWTAGASRAPVGGVNVLVQTSIGQCINAEGAPQGIAIVVNTQMRASAQ